MLEIIKERRAALQDVADTQKDLAKTDREIVITTADIILQEEALKKLREENADSEAIIAELEKERFNNKKLALQDEIDLLEEGSKTKLELEQELNDLLIDEEARKQAALKEQRDKEAEEEKKRKEETEAFLREQSLKTAQAVLNGLVKQ